MAKIKEKQKVPAICHRCGDIWLLDGFPAHPFEGACCTGVEPQVWQRGTQ